MVTSACALTTFLALVAYDAWPMGVLVTCFLWGVLMTLQFFVYGVHWAGKTVVAGGRMVRRGVGMAGRWLVTVTRAVGRDGSTISMGSAKG